MPYVQFQKFCKSILIGNSLKDNCVIYVRQVAWQIKTEIAGLNFQLLIVRGRQGSAAREIKNDRISFYGLTTIMLATTLYWRLKINLLMLVTRSK